MPASLLALVLAAMLADVQPATLTKEFPADALANLKGKLELLPVRERVGKDVTLLAVTAYLVKLPYLQGGQPVFGIRVDSQLHVRPSTDMLADVRVELVRDGRVVSTAAAEHLSIEEKKTKTATVTVIGTRQEMERWFAQPGVVLKLTVDVTDD